MNNGEQFFNTAAGGYSISRSLRFNSSDSAYLSRTAGSPTSSGTWTFSVWIKRSTLGADTAIIGGRTGGTASQIYFKSDNTLRWFENGADFSTTAVFRDVSSWYHFVFTKSGSTSCTIYVNGVQLQQNATSIPSTSPFNTNGAELFIGAVGLLPSGISFYAGHYFADAFFIDGQALDPTSFGEFDATTGVWMPKAYTGTYGTNGFKLNFSDNSTTAALGTDSSGRGNTWNVNNISVTAGAGNDSLVDVPTNGSEVDTGSGGQVRGNYATLNPLDWFVSSGTLSEGNLKWVSQTTGDFANRATIAVRTGKWYWEITADSVGAGGCQVGIAKTSTYSQSSGLALYQANNGNKVIDNSSTSYGATWVTGDVIGVAYDADAGKITFYKNNSSQGEITLSGYAGIDVSPVVWDASSLAFTLTLNFGQRPFAYTAPSGFKALNTSSLPAPVVTKPSTVMGVLTITGANQAYTGLNFSPDFLWFKRRDNIEFHYLFDAVRGGASILRSNLTDAESTGTTYISSFGANGFTTTNNILSAGASYVAWTWDAGSSTVTNTQGSISSQVRANASAGFSVVTWTGGGVDGSVGHGLGVAPVIYFVKNRSASSNWAFAYTIVDGSLDFMYLNLTNAAGNASQSVPTSTVINLQQSAGETTSGNNYVIYAFAPVAGYSAFGSYTGNGSADGPFVFTGMRPRWIMVKMSSASGEGWAIQDSTRFNNNPASDILAANSNGSETGFGGGFRVDLLSNGFKLRSTQSAHNASGVTYIYAAFAEAPFQYARAR
jgi:hypothetical protein